jgi:hypothetical protein
MQLANEDLVRARDLITHADMAANDARKASDLELKALPALTDQAQKTLASVNGAVASVEATSENASDQLTRVGEATASTLETSREMIAGLQPVEAQAADTLHEAQAFIRSPDIADTAHNVNLATANIAGISKNLDATSTDFQTKFHALLYPPPCKGFKCQIGRDIEYVKVGSQFVEPAFYLRQLLTGEQISGTVNVVRKPTSVPSK